MRLIHKQGDTKKIRSYKSEDGNFGWVEGYLVSWGNPKDTDLQGEFFTPRTEFCLDWFKDRPVLYHHGLDGETGLRKIGVIKSVEPDDLGLWVQAQLDLRDRYAVAVYDMVKSKDFGWSSGSVDHLVQISEGGEISTWPLIEGSITPTPAQPSKTMVRAFKPADANNNAVSAAKATNAFSRTSYLPAKVDFQAFKAILSDDSDYLRELEARVGSYEKSKNVVTRSSGQKRAKTMSPKNVTRQLAQHFAALYGVKATTNEINEVASKMDHVVRQAVIKANDEAENETELALRELEIEMKGEKTMATRRRPNAQRQVSRRKNSGGDSYMGAQMDDVAEKMADAISAEVEDELKAMAETEAFEKSAARAIRRKLYRKALRQIVATDDTAANIVNDAPILAGGTGESIEDSLYAGEPSFMSPPVENYKSRIARRRKTAAPSLEEEMKAEENAVMMEEVAKRAYENGMRKGIRRAFRTTDESGATSIDDPMIVEDLPAAASLRRRPSGARRGYSYREGQLPEAQYQVPAPTVPAGLAPAAPAAPAVAPAAPVAPAADPTEEAAVQSFRRGFRAARRDVRAGRSISRKNSSRKGLGEREVNRNNNLSRRNAAQKSVSTGRGGSESVEYWRNRAARAEQRAVKAEMMEAPNQRSFGSRIQVTDVADRVGAYSNAFKTYLRQGTDLMTDSEKYVLRAKGKVDWAKDGSVKAVKTGYSGSDASWGFAVPPDWVSELNKNVMTQTVMAPECRTRTTTSDRIVQPNLVTTDARRAYAGRVRWPGEVVTNPSADHRTSEQTLSQVNVPIHVMLVSYDTTLSSLEDVTFALEDEINGAFSEQVAIEYDTLIWEGSGQGKMQGIVVNNDVVGHRSTGIQTVSGYVPTGSPDGIVTADVIKEMMFHLPNGYKPKAKWYMNSNTALQIATLKDGEGNYLIDQRDEGLKSTGIPETLMGKPIVLNEWAQDASEGNYPIVLADLSRGYLIGKRVDFSIRRYDDSQQAEYDKVLFLGRARLGGQVLQPAAIKVLKVAES